MSEMVLLADHIDYVECLTPCEASIRELRLIHAHQPPYNRRSRDQKGHWWLIPPRSSASTLYSCTRTAPSTGSPALGPFRKRSTATAIGQLIHNDIRSGIAPTEPLTDSEKEACVHAIAELSQGISTPLIERSLHRLEEFSQQHLYEQAAVLRDITATAIPALTSLYQCQQLRQQDEIIVAESDGRGGWFFTAIRYGVFAGTVHCLRGKTTAPLLTICMPVHKLSSRRRKRRWWILLKSATFFTAISVAGMCGLSVCISRGQKI